MAAASIFQNMDSLMLKTFSLREQVYNYLREQMAKGELLPGADINMNKLSAILGVSKTPLRDALIQMECEGLVEILPRRGIRVTTTDLEDVRHAYDAIGALEGSIIASVFDRLEDKHIQRLEELNQRMIDEVRADNFDRYFLDNLAFHQVYLDLSGNEMVKRFVKPIKERLYDFPRRIYLPEWERRNCAEHQRFIDCVKAGDKDGAVTTMRDVHWSYEVQEPYIRRFYAARNEEIAACFEEAAQS